MGLFKLTLLIIYVLIFLSRRAKAEFIKCITCGFGTSPNCTTKKAEELCDGPCFVLVLPTNVYKGCTTSECSLTSVLNIIGLKVNSDSVNKSLNCCLKDFCNNTSSLIPFTFFIFIILYVMFQELNGRS